jgi:transcriptional regulator with GAF, ATPase, and Fis domain
MYAAYYKYFLVTEINTLIQNYFSTVCKIRQCHCPLVAAYDDKKLQLSCTHARTHTHNHTHTMHTHCTQTPRTHKPRVHTHTHTTRAHAHTHSLSLSFYTIITAEIISLLLNFSYSSFPFHMFHTWRWLMG